MKNLRIAEIKAFVPAQRGRAIEKFYTDLGSKMAYEVGGIVYVCFDHVSFLFQEFCAEPVATKRMMLPRMSSHGEGMCLRGCRTKISCELCGYDLIEYLQLGHGNRKRIVLLSAPFLAE